MKKILVTIYVLIMLLQACTGNKKMPTAMPCYMPELPYRALDDKSLDTTFDYEVLEKNIDATLPDIVFGKKVEGTVELYSMIDASKHVTDIKLITCKLYKKDHLVYEYNENMNKDIDSSLKNFLLAFMQDKPFKQTKPATLQQHPTYCFIRFY
jgi:hypothetical protein